MKPYLPIIGMFAAGLLMGLGIGGHYGSAWSSLPAPAAKAEPAYSVILTVQNGNEYVVYHGLSAEDCEAAKAKDWPDGACVLEPLQRVPVEGN